jgi:hypothetical protein
MPYPLKVEVGKKNHPAKQTPRYAKAQGKTMLLSILIQTSKSFQYFTRGTKKKKRFDQEWRLIKKKVYGVLRDLTEYLWQSLSDENNSVACVAKKIK